MIDIRRVLLVATSVVAIACSPAPSGTLSPATTGTANQSAPPSVEVSIAPPSPSPEPTTVLVAADLDGVLTTADLAHRLPLAVSIDDSAAARPQAGFNAASIIWQAPADGYESRYLLVFQELDATDIGPVRSARSYLAHWAAEEMAAFGHYGGDRITRSWIATNAGTLFTNVDGIGSGNPAYHRIATRPSPHNAYTSSSALRSVALRLGAEPLIGATVHIRPFRDDAAPSARGTVGTVRIPYRTVVIRYVYDRATDAYGRFLGPTAQLDPMDGHQVDVRTVVVLFMPFHTDSTIEPGHSRPVLGFVGRGRAIVYTEGTAVEAVWSKPREGDPTRILAPDGTELPFVRGRIAFQIVPIGTSVTTGSLP